MPKLFRGKSQQYPRWERRKESRPEEILDAAIKLFAEKGFNATRLDDVAKLAGISKGTLYLYFKDKEEIFKQVVENGIIPNIEEIEKVVGETLEDNNIENLISIALKQMAVIVTTTPIGAIPKIMISEAGNFPNLTQFYRDEVLVRLHKLFAKLIDAGIDKGQFRKVPSLDAARVLLSTVFMMAIASNMPGFKETLLINSEQQIETTLDIWFRGIRVEGDMK